MVDVPPGVQYVAINALKLSVPITTIHLLLLVLQDHLPIPPISLRATILAGLALALPVAAISRRVTNFLIRRRAAAKGAILPGAVVDPWPFNLGTLRTLIDIFNSGYIGDGFIKLAGHFGSIYTLQAGFTPIQYVTIEPSHVKAILATQFDDFEKGEVFQDQMRSVLGTGVFNSDGDMWKFHRSMTRPYFNKERVTDFDIFDAHAMDAISQAKKRLLAGHAVEFQDLCSRISLDSATAFLFNNDVRSLSAGLVYPPGTPEAMNIDAHPSSAFARAFGDAQHRVAFRTFLGKMWPLSEMTGDKTKANMRTVNSYIDPIIAEALRRKRDDARAGTDLKSDKDGKVDPEHTSLLDYLVGVTDDHAVIRDETLNIMIAGRDTISSAMTYGAYMLAENPHVLKRLRQEILECVGPTSRPTYDDIRSMRYLRAFINETLRLYPPVPFDVRYAVRDTTLPSITPGGLPYFVPKNAQCIYSVFLMHRRTDLWGPDALVFDPDRFIDERVHKYLTPNPFIFLPFNAGPRICLGQQFAYNEISFTLIRLLQAFDSISLARDVQPPDTLPPASWKEESGRKAAEKIFPKQHLTLYILGGLWVRMGIAEGSHAD